MQRIGLLVLGMASLVAGSVIMDRGGRVALHGIGGLGLQTVQGLRGGIGGGNVLTKDDLLKQKFILDILHNIYTPLQHQELLMLDDRQIVANENLYIRPLTQEMQMVLDLIHSNQMLNKQAVCSINNKQHVRQAVGLYRLLVAARDFETFKHLVVYARQHVNNEMFVLALILALGERPDTQLLIVPALHEILPQLFIKDHIIDQVQQQLDTGVSSVRPQLFDVMGGPGRRSWFLNSRFDDQQQQQQQQNGLWGVLNRSQLWMPWRELHRQIAVRKMTGAGQSQQYESQLDKVIISIPGNGLLSQDIGLKSYVAILVDELLLNQDTLRHAQGNYGSIGGIGNDYNQNILLGGRGQKSSPYGSSFAQHQYDSIAQQDIHSDRLWPVGKRYRTNVFDVNDDDVPHNVYGSLKHATNIDVDTDVIGNRAGLSGIRQFHHTLDNEHDVTRHQGGHFGSVEDESDLFLAGRRGIQNRLGLDQDQIDIEHGNTYGGSSHLLEGQQGINTVSINDPRLLFVGRRNKNPANVLTSRQQIDNSRSHLGYINQMEEDDFISGARHVSNDRKNRDHHNSKYNRYDDDASFGAINNDRYIKNNRRGKVQIDSDQDDLYWSQNRGFNSKKNRDYYHDFNAQESYQKYPEHDYINRYSYGHGVEQEEEEEDVNSGRSHDDFLNIISRGRIGQRQAAFANDQDLKYKRGYVGQNSGESLDKHLPTTSINDERLLHINRRKLNPVVEGRMENDFQYDNVKNGYYSGHQGYPRGNEHQQQQQRSYLDNKHSYLDVQTHDYQDIYAVEEDSVNNRGDKRGHRFRRSIVNKDLGQTSTINGKLLLHSLQQLVAHLNIERIALGQPLLIDSKQHGFVGHSNIQAAVEGQTVHKIENILQHIDQVLQQHVGQITIPSYNQKINEIGLILAGQIQELGLTEILGDILQPINQQPRKGLIVNMLENEAAQILLAGIVQVVDQRLQQIYLQRKEFINTVQGITINTVGVDKLQTFVEQSDIDLSNLLHSHQIEETVQGPKKVVVGRVARLNHKSFNIEIDVSADRQQQVVVRNLLVPKVDGLNNIIPLEERRQNIIVLDVTTAELQQGRNSLKLNSNDITITSRDTTPLTKIYQLVMHALNDNEVLQQNRIAGQSSLWPHRLLLPRGRSNGLTMQLITVITPLTGSAGIRGIQKGAELNTLFLDNLPLNYPLHCDITDLDDVIAMPNLMVKDVKIYHEDSVKMSSVTMY